MIDFNNIQKYRENNRIEAKKAIGGLPKSLWESYSAFANTVGGIILLGVEELSDRSFQTVTLPHPEKLVSEFWNIINNNQKVSVNILMDKNVQIHEVQGNHIIAIEIPRANRKDKPVYIGVDPFSGTYRRNGEGDYHCTKDEVRNMMRDQADISQDLRVLEHMSLEVFDYDSIKRYRIRMMNLRPGHVWESFDNIDFLQKLGATDRGEDGKPHPTIAGLLMFGFEYEIVKEFPNYFLDYREKMDSQIRWTDRIISSSGDWSGNIFDFYFRVYNKIAQDIKVPFKLDKGIDRIDDTPVHEALREALANSIIHANYYDRRGLVIEKNPDKIIIANPGGFRMSIADAISGGISDPRNTTLIKMFNLINIGERAGSGLPSIHHVWKEQGLGVPIIEEKFNPDRTILTLSIKTSDKKQAIKTSDKSTIYDLQKAIVVDFVTTNITVKSSEVVKLLNVSAPRARAILSKLVEEDILIAEGGNRNRAYRLKS